MMKDDTISRVAASEAVCKMLKNCFNATDEMIESVKITVGELPSAQPSVSKEEIIGDTISRQWLMECVNEGWIKFDTGKDENRFIHLVRDIAPSAQPEQRCVNCGRTANNGGWYKDGRTRCPIEEHYALPKDGYCHLWEKKKVWEDDYVKRPEEGEK